MHRKQKFLKIRRGKACFKWLNIIGLLGRNISNKIWRERKHIFGLGHIFFLFRGRICMRCLRGSWWRKKASQRGLNHHSNGWPNVYYIFNRTEDSWMRAAGIVKREREGRRQGVIWSKGLCAWSQISKQARLQNKNCLNILIRCQKWLIFRLK